MGGSADRTLQVAAYPTIGGKLLKRQRKPAVANPSLRSRTPKLSMASAIRQVSKDLSCWICSVGPWSMHDLIPSTARGDDLELLAPDPLGLCGYRAFTKKMRDLVTRFLGVVNRHLGGFLRTFGNVFARILRGMIG